MYFIASAKSMVNITNGLKPLNQPDYSRILVASVHTISKDSPYLYTRYMYKLT